MLQMLRLVGLMRPWGGALMLSSFGSSANHASTTIYAHNYALWWVPKSEPPVLYMHISRQCCESSSQGLQRSDGAGLVLQRA